MTLHERLLAAVTARQERARAAQPGPWMTGEIAEHLVDAVVYGQSSSWPGHITQACNVEYADGGMANARFIAAEEPVAVLRHCERDLKVIERHVIAEREPLDVRPQGRPVCYCCSDWWPCEDVADLAEAYGLEAS